MKSPMARLSMTDQPKMKMEKFGKVFACPYGSVWDMCSVLKYALVEFDDVSIDFIFTSEIEADEDENE